MNRRIGIVSSFFNTCAVVGFAICMLLGFSFGNFLASTFIALSFVFMIGSFAARGTSDVKAAGNAAMIFAAMYAAIILLVYFAQVTTLRLQEVNEQARSLIDYSSFGLFFNYDLLGYCLMAFATFFAGMTIKAKAKPQKALKLLLMIHGVFALSCFIMPMLGIFNADMQGASWTGTVILLFWCLYFIPVSVLSLIHFKSWNDNDVCEVPPIHERA